MHLTYFDIVYSAVCVCVCPCPPQLKVLPRDLQLCSETASGVDAGGQHEWGELVQLDPQTVGVIVRLERETFQVPLSTLFVPKVTVSPKMVPLN